MGEDILTQIERGRRVGYSDSLIRKSLELDDYSPDSIKLAFRQADQKKNGNGTKYRIKNVSMSNIQLDAQKALGIRENPESMPTLKIPQASSKPGFLFDLLIGAVVFVVVGILMYLFIVPSLINVI
ncbi:MAG: hypothetical protein Q8P15_01560 [Nanoarchaeota archaeon]|nr:hypothetical protein [Nanoarchaeota archaeon]